LKPPLGRHGVATRVNRQFLPAHVGGQA